MITIEEALERILANVHVLDREEIGLLDALGQTLDEDIYAEFNCPPLDNSAMDGYAVRAADTTGASYTSPCGMTVIGEVAAGYIYDRQVKEGTAVRIMTGAPLPKGADAVVPFEDTDEPLKDAAADAAHRPPQGARTLTACRINVMQEVRCGANVRLAGEDVKTGDLVLQKGKILRPSEIGVIASLGRDTVRVIRRPVVAVLSTGDELVEAGQARFGAQIYDANAYSIGAMVTRCGGVPRLMGAANDTVEALTAKIRAGLVADMLVTSAGVSLGDYDLVKEVLASEGQITFCTVSMKPGKPLAFGTFEKSGRRIPHIGLPGNPVSAGVAFELFGRPAILKMLGKRDFRRPIVRAIAKERITNFGEPRALFARCIVIERDGQYSARLTGPQGSGMLTSMMHANGLTVIPADIDVVEAGDEVDVLMLDWSHGEESGTFLTTDVE